MNLLLHWLVISWALSGCWWFKALFIIPLIWILPTLSLGHRQHRPQSQAQSECLSLYKRFHNTSLAMWFKIFFFFYEWCTFFQIFKIMLGLWQSINQRSSIHIKNIQIRKATLGLWAHKYLQSWVLALYNNISFYIFHSNPWNTPDLFSRLLLIFSALIKKLSQQHCDDE